MRPLFAIVGLLLCLIATRAGELPVIKDSEAIRYVGKSVEVRGLAVSVTVSPLGTALINFDQTQYLVEGSLVSDKTGLQKPEPGLAQLFLAHTEQSCGGFVRVKT